MRKFLLLAFVVVFAGCVKNITDKIQYNIIKDAITKGYWKVTSLKRDTTDVTASFSTYKFKFNEDFTVNALKNSVIERSGTWDADTSASTITSNFPGAPEPLSLLNGTWKMIDNSLTYVLAKQTVNGEYRELRLDKE